MSEILEKRDGAVLTLSLNRPAKMNAITRVMYGDLVQALKNAAGDFSIRVVLITSEGPNFTAGNDIYDFVDAPPSGPDSEVFQFLQEIHNFPKPLMACVRGRAIGVGTTMLLHCDLVVADSTAKFSAPFVSLGLVPEAGSSYLLPALVGYQRAAKIFLTGDSFSAQEALEMGLICVVADNAYEEAIALARQIAEQPPTAVINVKALLKSRSHDAVSAVMEVEGELFRLALQSDESMAAFAKFMSAKQKP